MSSKRPNSRSELPVLPFSAASAWEAWLRRNHAASAGIWIEFAKRESGIPSITHAEALDVALCYGWIDGQVKRIDHFYFIQRFTPRRPKSRWSKVNCDKAMKLMKAGRMQPAGMKQVESAKADGRWDAAYEPPSTATVPDDLGAALDGNQQARKFFESLDSRNRYAILYRIQDAKRPETRSRRINTFVAMLARGEKLHSGKSKGNPRGRESYQRLSTP